MGDFQKIKTRMKRGWYIIGVLVAFVFITAAVRVWWGIHADAVLHAEIDSIRARGEKLEWREFITPPVPADQNAVITADEAKRLGGELFAETPSDEETKKLLDWLDEAQGDWSMLDRNSPQAMAILRQSQAILARARIARSQTACEWEMDRTSTAMESAVPHMAHFRVLEKIICLAAMEAHARGDDAAVEYLRDGLALSRVARSNPTLLGQMVALSLEAIVYDAIVGISASVEIGAAPAVGHEQLNALIGELLDERETREGYAFGMMFERALNYDMFQGYREGQLPEQRGTDKGMGPGWAIVLLVGGPAIELEEAHMLRSGNSWVLSAREDTFPGAMSRLPSETSPGEGLRAAMHVLRDIMAPTMKKILVYQYRVITARRATAVALAIRLYQIDHGSRPERLDELAAYLPSMPADPFRSDGRPLGYLPHAALAMLYSVSKDGGDDSGAFVRSTDGTVLLDESPDMVFFLDHDQASRAWRAATEPATQPASSPATTPSAATSP